MSVRTRRDLVVLTAAVTALTLLSAVQAEAADAPTLDDAAPPAEDNGPTPSVAPTSSVPPPIVLPTTTTAVRDPVGVAIRRWFPDVEAQARDVAWCESKHDPEAVSPTGDHGLFQINDVHRASFEAVTGVPFDQGIYDPEFNASFARWLYEEQGWDPWTCA